LINSQARKHIKKLLTLIIILTAVFSCGALLGGFIVLFNKLIPLRIFTTNLLFLSFGLFEGLRIYSLMSERVGEEYKITIRKSIPVPAYLFGIYFILFKYQGPTEANLFIACTILGLIVTITAPPFLAKFLRPVPSKKSQ